MGGPEISRPPDSVIESGEGYGYIIIVELTERGAIGDTSNVPESGLSPVHHDPSNPDPKSGLSPIHHNPSNPDPTPENHNNHRGMSSSHKYQGRCSSNKDSGHKLVEALQLPGER